MFGLKLNKSNKYNTNCLETIFFSIIDVYVKPFAFEFLE